MDEDTVSATGGTTLLVDVVESELTGTKWAPILVDHESTDTTEVPAETSES